MELLVHYRGTLITAVLAVAVGLASYAVVSSDPLAGHRDRSFTMDFSRVYDVDPALIQYEQTREFSVSMAQPRGISVGPEDQIYVAGDQTVGVYRPDGTTLAMIPTEGRPSCLAVGNDQHVAPGHIYVGSGNRIEVFDDDGSRVATWNVPTDDAILASIAVADESVFVADAGNRLVWRFDPSGELLGTIGNAEAGGRTFNVPSTTFDIAIGPGRQLHVANPGALRIETYTFDGALQARWGNPGVAIENFFGCCNPSQFAVLPEGEIVTSEKGVPRIKVYSEYGEFRSVVAGPRQLGIAQSELGDPRPHQAGVVFDVAADSQGRVWVLDPRRKSVRVFVRLDEHTGGIGFQPVNLESTGWKPIPLSAPLAHASRRHGSWEEQPDA
ncbi:NHL repeat-containing protein [Rhodopirellula sp. JC639]|uniref:NHL repeat-containing protein n=1 Tax=Stieleria mannarensis TaxID=2755585 RepID=UPI0015FF08A4|nr:NHL repeat-containing protein [Rhodopirellula sp. JC639]